MISSLETNMNDTALNKPPTTGKTASRKLLIWTTIIFVPVGVLGVLGSYVSLFMFDQPGSGRNPFLYTAVLSMFSLPLMCVISIPCSWTFHVYKKYKAAKYTALSPLLSIGSFVLMWFFAIILQF
jgi:hypothetical protein